MKTVFKYLIKTLIKAYLINEEDSSIQKIKKIINDRLFKLKFIHRSVLSPSGANRQKITNIPLCPVHVRFFEDFSARRNGSTFATFVFRLWSIRSVTWTLFSDGPRTWWILRRCVHTYVCTYLYGLFRLETFNSVPFLVRFSFRDNWTRELCGLPSR